MTNEEQWPIGTRVKFDYDGLISNGIIIRHKEKSAVVCLDVANCGWKIDAYEAPDLPQYYGRYGWIVRYSYLQRYKTKLGNIL
jgi:hypothetical protein